MNDFRWQTQLFDGMFAFASAADRAKIQGATRCACSGLLETADGELLAGAAP